MINDAVATIPTGDVYYYPGTNQLLICAEEDSVRFPKNVTLTAKNLVDKNGNDASFSAACSLAKLYEVPYGELGLQRVSYEINGTPAANIVGKTGVSVLVRISNSTSKPVNDTTVKVYDGASLVGSGSVNVPASGFAEVLIDTSSHKFIYNNAKVVIE